MPVTADMLVITADDLPGVVEEKYPELKILRGGFSEYEIPDKPRIFNVERLTVYDREPITIPNVKVLLSHGVLDQNGRLVFQGDRSIPVVDTVLDYNRTHPSPIEAVVICNPSRIDESAPIYLSEFSFSTIGHAVGSNVVVNMIGEGGVVKEVAISLQNPMGRFFGFKELAVLKDVQILD